MARSPRRAAALSIGEAIKGCNANDRSSHNNVLPKIFHFLTVRLGCRGRPRCRRIAPPHAPSAPVPHTVPPQHQQLVHSCPKPRPPVSPLREAPTPPRPKLKFSRERARSQASWIYLPSPLYIGTGVHPTLAAEARTDLRAGAARRVGRPTAAMQDMLREGVGRGGGSGGGCWNGPP